MNRHPTRATCITALLFISTVQQGYDAQIMRISSNPVRAFEGSDALFQWTLSKDLTSRPDFQGLIFGLWRNGYLATYITTVTRTNRIISNPGLKEEAPQLGDRVQWKGDLSKSLAAFQISHVSTKDQMDYGLLLDFGALKDSEADFVSLQIEAEKSAITAGPSPPLSVAPGKNASFYCEFHVGEADKSLYDGVSVGLWEQGGIYRTFLTLTKDENIIMNPKLDQEAPEYYGRVNASYFANKTSNTSIISVVLAHVKKSDERSYGCSMYFGPFKEPVGSYVRIDVQGIYSTRKSHALKNNSETSLVVRVGRNISIPCPILAEVIQMDGTFKALYWSYCVSKICTTTETKWLWLAGENDHRTTKVTQEGRYANRVNLIQNGTLKINNVEVADATDYRCTVRRINYTSPRVYFVSIGVDSTVRPVITKRSPSKVEVNEGNVLYLKCEAMGVPRPLVIWSRNGEVLQSGTNETNFVREDASEDDAGNYECKALNSAGSDSYHVEVAIKGEDDIWIIIGTVLAIAVFIVVSGIIAFCFIRKKLCRNNCSSSE